MNVNGYMNEGHPRKLTEKEWEIISNITNCIPNHFALNPDKPDNVRLIYNATVKYQNVSIDNKLLKGPDLLNNLGSILINFRKGKYSVSGDIEKMLYEVKVKEGDRDALKLFWWGSPTDEISHFLMLVGRFGNINSPCYSNYALKCSGLDQRENICQGLIEPINNDINLEFIWSHVHHLII